MSQPYRPNLITRVYYAYRSLSLPFRKKFFRGFDLDGNKFYESYNPLTPHKLRRTVQYVHDGHYTDNNVTPQWMAWLRHTRPTAPTMEELTGEVARIQRTRSNAALVNRRWEEERARLLLEQQGGTDRPEVKQSLPPAAPTGRAASGVRGRGTLESTDEPVVAAAVGERQAEREHVLQEARDQEESVQGRGKEQSQSSSDPVTTNTKTTTTTTTTTTTEEGSRNADYTVAPGTRDEKGEWQPESWKPTSARAPIRR